MRKKITICFALVLFLFTLSSCGWQYVFSGPGLDDAYRFAAWQREQEKLFEPWFGQSPEAIEVAFGKPESVEYAKPPSHLLPQYADFCWDYGRLPDRQGKYHEFYFKNNRLIYVKVLPEGTIKL